MPIELLILFGLAALGLAWFGTQPLRRSRRQRRYREPPFPVLWRKILRRDMPYYRRLPSDLQRQLQKHIQVFLAEKNFVGCHGLTVTEQMRVLIAAQACLLLFNRKTGYYPNMREILVYPDAFMVERNVADAAGVVHRVRHAVSGESWADSQVVLSWPDVLAGATDAHDGYNVVIHEFAHQLDHESGAGNGAPAMADQDQATQWAQALNVEFIRLREQIDQREPTLLDQYGAQDPVEFFAVASETFFERPARLSVEHPVLYRELSRFYCVNPLSW